VSAIFISVSLANVVLSSGHGLRRPFSLPYPHQAFQLDTASGRRLIAPRKTPGIPSVGIFDKSYTRQRLADPKAEAFLRDQVLSPWRLSSGIAATVEERSLWTELRDRSWRSMSETHRRIARRIIRSEVDPGEVADLGEL
jgi:hypothetical protein